MLNTGILSFLFRSEISAKDIVLLSISLLFTIALTFIVYTIKPKLSIGLPAMKPDRLKIQISNIGCSDAVNLRIEACNVKEEFTYHFEIDRSDFIILPKKQKNPKDTSSFRTFQLLKMSPSALTYGYEFSQAISDISEGKAFLRIRVHASHSLTGFGKAFEGKFAYRDGLFREV